jgi:plasmid stabilization system protein ParE
MSDILDYIQAHSPQGAENVKSRLKAAIDLIADHPESGRATNKGDLRRILANPYPYGIFYRTDAAGIVVHGVRHSARRPH